MRCVPVEQPLRTSSWHLYTTPVIGFFLTGCVNAGCEQKVKQLHRGTKVRRSSPKALIIIPHWNSDTSSCDCFVTTTNSWLRLTSDRPLCTRPRPTGQGWTWQAQECTWQPERDVKQLKEAHLKLLTTLLYSKNKTIEKNNNNKTIYVLGSFKNVRWIFFSLVLLIVNVTPFSHCTIIRQNRDANVALAMSFVHNSSASGR